MFISSAQLFHRAIFLLSSSRIGFQVLCFRDMAVCVAFDVMDTAESFRRDDFLEDFSDSMTVCHSTFHFHARDLHDVGGGGDFDGVISQVSKVKISVEDPTGILLPAGFADDAFSRVDLNSCIC